MNFCLNINYVLIYHSTKEGEGSVLGGELRDIFNNS